MGLVIRIIASPEGEPVTDWNIPFPEEGGSIGRLTGVTMQLADSRRVVSGTHAIISRDCQGYRITDVSTNGLYVNGSARPLGRDQHMPLNDGDILDVGDYRLQVTCFSPEKAAVRDSPLEDRQGSVDADSDVSNREPEDRKQALPGMGAGPGGRSESQEKEQGKDEGFSLEPDPFADDDDDEMSYLYGSDIDGSMSPATASGSGSGSGLPPDSTDTVQSEDGSSEGDPLLFDDERSISIHRTSSETSGMSFMPGKMTLFDRRNHASDMDLYECMEVAFCRVIEELDPDQLAAMFDEYSSRRWIMRWLPGRKATYWRMYCHYFHQTMSNRGLLMKFRGCFDELYHNNRRQCWHGKDR